MVSIEEKMAAANPTERILEAAREVFANEGLDAQLETIARRAGVGVGSIYRRYGNKNDLIQVLAEERFSGLVARMSSTLDDPDPWEAFATEFRRSVAEYASDRGFRELVIGSVTGSLGWARGSEPDDLQAAILRWSGEMEAVIDRVIGRARDAGSLRADASGSVILLLSMALQSVAGLGDAAGHDLAITIVLDGLRARG
jgi:AcrR family transcriptional regulator